jgi:hypothetical protein
MIFLPLPSQFSSAQSTPEVQISAASGPFCGKSMEVPFHEQFTNKNGLFQSCSIVPNRA